MAAEASLKTFHLSAALPCLISAEADWRRTSASVIGRRPNGVVTLPVCIVFHLSAGKRNQLTKTAPKTLDEDSRKCDSVRAKETEGLPRRQR
jgi:hypothetical protein